MQRERGEAMSTTAGEVRVEAKTSKGQLLIDRLGNSWTYTANTPSYSILRHPYWPEVSLSIKKGNGSDFKIKE